MLPHKTDLYPLCGEITDVTIYVDGMISGHSVIIFRDRGCNFLAMPQDGNIMLTCIASLLPPHERIDSAGVVTNYRAQHGIMSFTWQGTRTNYMPIGPDKIPYRRVHMYVKFHKKGHFDFIRGLLRDINPKYV